MIRAALGLLVLAGCVGDVTTQLPRDVDGGEAASADALSDVQSGDTAACNGGVLYYLDGDHDGYGGTTKMSACAPPAANWITKSGDCDDGNAVVNPGQTAYFGVGYTVSGSSLVSFDYDCNGVESESGGPPKANCQSVSVSCVGSGYVAATPPRSGNVDPYCGSENAVTCAFAGLNCMPGPAQAANAVSCR